MWDDGRMTTHTITLSRETTASPEKVWRVLSDIPGAPENISGIDSVEMLSDQPYGVGTRWRETRTMFGKQASEEMWVTAADAPHKTVVEAESSGTHYTTSFTIAPSSGGSLVTFEFAGTLVSGSGWQKFMWKAFGRFGLGFAAKAMRADLDDIAAAAENLS